jgi:hypothetical protein
MSNPVRIFFFIIGGMFLLIGLAGMFRPDQVMDGLGLASTGAEGREAVRAIVGGHYAGMGLTCLVAAARRLPAVLLAIGAIAATMVLARLLSFAAGEVTPPAVVQTLIEVAIAVVALPSAWRATAKK